MVEDIVMRTAIPQDIDSLIELIYETIDISYSGVYSQEAIDYFKKYHNRENILNDIIQGYCIVLIHGKKVIGTGTLLLLNTRRVFVKPEYQKKGLGKRIMFTLEEKALEERAQIVILEASLVAYSFYKSLGYKTQAEDVIPVNNGQVLRYYKMIKSLLPCKYRFNKQLQRHQNLGMK